MMRGTASWVVGLGVAMVVAGCVSPASPTCGDLVCAVGQVCAPGVNRCASPVAIAACADHAELDECTAGSVSGVCRDGICTVYACGNAIVEVGEVCDDGNVRSGDGCSADCQSKEVCGNGIRDNAEACDDGNTVSGDGCQANCSLPTCGDGTLDPGEACDDGNNLNKDGCNAACTSNETCQNGVVDPQTGEECDDHNAIASDGCQPNCKVPRCGDNYVDPGEVCDNGNTVSGDGCSADCKSKEVCGNGYVDVGEQCDGGSTSTPNGVEVDTATCNADCTVARCGDGKLNMAASETCDAPLAPSTCDPDCTLPLCGDGIANIAAGETCDLGLSNSNAPNSPCRLDCTRERCGDGILDPNDGEDCDGSVPAGFTCQDFGFYDATTLGCSASCNFDTSQCSGYCGDRELRSGVEVCEGQAPPNASCADYGFDSGALGCRTSCAPDFSQCKLAAAWTPLPSQTVGVAYGLWGSSPTDVIAVGSSGGISRYNGSGWSAMTSPTGNNLIGIWGSSSSDVFAVGEAGTILHYNGSNWSTMTSGTALNLEAVWGTGPDDVYAVGGGPSAAIVLHYTIAGGWTALPASGASSYLLAVWGAGGKVFVGGDGDTIYVWNGSSWTPQVTGAGSTQYRSIWGTSASDIFAVGYGGVIAHYNGSSWTPMTSGSTQYLYSVWGTASSDVFVVGEGGTALHWNGSSWSTMSTNASSGIYAMWGGSGEVFAVGSGLGAFHIKLGPTWFSISPSTVWLDSVWGTSATDVYVAGNYCYVYHWDGSGWSPITIPSCSFSYTSFYGTWGTSSSNYFIVGSGPPTGNEGTINHYKSGTWTSVPTAHRLLSVWGSSTSDVYAVGLSGTILHYDGNAGDTWTTVAPGMSVDTLQGVWGSGPSDVFVVAWGGKIFHWNGLSWSTTTIPSQIFYGIWGAGPNNVFVVGNGGVIFHYDGTSWTAMASGTNAQLTAISGTTANDVFAAGNGVIVHYDGTAWSRMNTGSTSGLFSVWAGTDTFAVGHSGVALRYRRYCAASETSCGDGTDEDCDGYTDCDDADCAANLTCSAGGVCAGWQAISCNQNLSDTTVGGPSNITAYGCDSWLEGGRERVYRLAATSTASVTATLSGMTKDLDLVVTETSLGGACQPSLAGCLGASSTQQANETVTFAAQSGKAYYIIVDGYSSNAGAFTLDVSCQ